MFDNILSNFTDFPTIDILFYAPTSNYDPATGEMTTGYAYDYTVQSHAFQKSATKGLFNEKVFDSIDMMFIFPQSEAPPEMDIVWHDQIWYKIIYPENVGFAGSVCVIGAQRIDEQIETTDDPGNYTVIGDTGGIV